MKKFKLAIFSIAMVLLVFTSCTNEETIVDPQQNTEESESITTTFNQLSRQFDQNGNLNSDNPAGNVVFDFCFDFVYPLDLSFNNGTTVTANSLDDIIDLIISSTDELYVNGIAFPFNVETYNESTNAIEIVTINNEDEFITLLNSCEFDDPQDCICTAEYDPVCVEVSDINGETFTITYPNACDAECDGFTEDDFVDNCEEDYNPSGNECFTLNYPLSIVTADGTTFTVNSEEELSTATYGLYEFDFVYPFTVTLENEEVVTVNSSEDFETILSDCYEDNTPNECDECLDAVYDPVCVEVNGQTYAFDNACYALCAGYTEDNFVECNSTSDCSTDEISSALINNDGWVIGDYNGSQEFDVYDITFNADGTLEWTANDGAAFSGSWSIEDNPATGGNTLTLIFSGPNLQEVTGSWRVIGCDLPCFIAFQLDNNTMVLSRSCD